MASFLSDNNAKEYKLKEISTFVYGKMPNKSKFIVNGYPVYSGYRISGYYPEYMFEREKLLIIARGVGGTGDMKISPPKAFITNLSIVFNENEYIVDYRYLYYYLSIRNMRTLDTGSCQSQITINQLEEYKVLLPEKVVQQNISRILSSIEYKIELNNKINAELEAMAKTLYDYWFVQFDFPFVTSSGVEKPYKTSGGKIVWNEELKREIPEGWEVKELRDISNITMGQSPPGESYNEESNGTVFYQGCTDFGNRFPTIRKYTTSPTRYAKQGDILLSVRAPVGTMNIAKENCCIGRGLAALNSKDNSMSYLYEVMINLKQVFDRRNVNGTTFGSITKDDLFSLKVVSPTKDILLKYSNITNPFFEKQNLLEEENQQLASLRDWLLPMLMNGQVRVGDVEEELGMVAEPNAGYNK